MKSSLQMGPSYKRKQWKRRELRQRGSLRVSKQKEWAKINRRMTMTISTMMMQTWLGQGLEPSINRRQIQGTQISKSALMVSHIPAWKRWLRKARRTVSPKQEWSNLNLVRRTTSMRLGIYRISTLTQTIWFKRRKEKSQRTIRFSSYLAKVDLAR